MFFASRELALNRKRDDSGIYALPLQGDHLDSNGTTQATIVGKV
jgi:hypothetical protein